MRTCPDAFEVAPAGIASVPGMKLPCRSANRLAACLPQRSGGILKRRGIIRNAVAACPKVHNVNAVRFAMMCCLIVDNR